MGEERKEGEFITVYVNFVLYMKGFVLGDFPKEFKFIIIL